MQRTHVLLWCLAAATATATAMACSEDSDPASGGLLPADASTTDPVDAPASEPGDGAALDGSVPPPPPPVEASGLDVDSPGTRLVPRFVRAGSLQSPVGWTDQARAQHCTLGTIEGVAADQRACLPSFTYLDTVLYGAADCSGSEYHRTEGSGGAILPGLCEPAQLGRRGFEATLKLFGFGEPIAAGSACFANFTGTCQPFGGSCTSLRRLDAEVPPDAFAVGIPTRAGGAESPGVEQFVFADGAKAFVGWRNGEVACSPATGSDGRLHCFDGRYVATQFVDALCLVPAYASPAEAGTIPPPYLELDDSCAGARRLHAAAPVATARPQSVVGGKTQLYGFGSGQCSGRSVVDASTVYVAGGELPPTTVPSMELAVLETERLRAEYVQASGYKQLTRIYDKQLGAHCTFMKLAEGVRCVPSERIMPPSALAETIYSDAACTMPVVLTAKPTDSCAREAPLFIGSVGGGCTVALDLAHAVAAPSRLYARSATGCTPAAFDTSNLYTRGEAIVPSTLASAELDP